MKDVRLRLSADERRASILEQAKVVFAQLGYQQAGTREIAAACGISEATLYQHFRSKKQLFLEIFYSFGGQHHERWKRLVSEQVQQQGREGLERAFITYRILCAADPTLAQLLTQIFSETNDPDMAEAARKYLQSIRMFLYELVEQARATGMLPFEIDGEILALQGTCIFVMMLVTRMVQSTSAEALLTDTQLVQLGQGWLRSCISTDT
ncbi:MAG: TetR/AcrR family transcriptional regulator [Ktedonobacteraceae bacterium]|nr:TetR/AcrR family transcriptional regulator [Ktedonobacteraceae bacterium]